MSSQQFLVKHTCGLDTGFIRMYNNSRAWSRT